MKRVLLILILFILALPTLAFAQALPSPDAINACLLVADLRAIDPACGDGVIVGPPGSLPGFGITEAPGWAACCIVNTVFKIADWIFIALMGIVFIFVLLGAYNIITAGGSPDKVITGRNYILFAIVGLVAAFLARAVPNFAVFLIRGI